MTYMNTFKHHWPPGMPPLRHAWPFRAERTSDPGKWVVRWIGPGDYNDAHRPIIKRNLTGGEAEHLAIILNDTWKHGHVTGTADSVSSNGLAARIRAMYIEMRSKNPGGVEGFDTPLLFEVIAALEGATTGERQRANSSPTP